VRLPAGYRSRPAEPADLDAVVALFRATDLADAGIEDPVREHLEGEWRRPSFSLERDTLLVHAEDGSAAAYVEVTGVDPDRTLDAHVRIHPAHRGRGLGDALVRWSQEHALDRSPRLERLFADAPEGDGAGHALLDRHGFAWVRTFWHLERSLAGELPLPEVPDGVSLRPYRHDADVLTAYEALEDAFRDHWEYEPYPYEDHVAEMREWDRGLAWLAEADGALAGVCLSRLVEGGGWVDAIGVRRPWRGRGIARALLLRSFAALVERGATWAMLNVDAESATGATRLYESVGMRVRRAWRVFEKRLGPGLR
jgi:mycothiol synthase